MKISSYMNNINSIMGKNEAKVQKEKNQAKGKTVTEQSAKLSISREGMEHYRSHIQQNGQETYDELLWRRELLKSGKISDIDYGYEISKKATQRNKEAASASGNALSMEEKAKGYAAAYKELQDEILQGYESGTLEVYVADENGIRKLTREEELSNLDAAYQKTMEDFVTRETTSQHARGIIGKELDKISQITARSGKDVLGITKGDKENSYIVHFSDSAMVSRAVARGTITVNGVEIKLTEEMKKQLLKVDKEAKADREKAYHDYVMQHDMAVAEQQGEAWRKALGEMPESLKLLLKVYNPENAPESSEKQNGQETTGEGVSWSQFEWNTYDTQMAVTFEDADTVKTGDIFKGIHQING